MLGKHAEVMELYYPPFRDCGDQLQDCQHLFRPVCKLFFFLSLNRSDILKQNFCCPPRMRCHATTWSPSGVYCCEDDDKCIVSKKHPATCIADTVECGHEMGGGCCPPDSICSPDGCLEVSVFVPPPFPEMKVLLNITPPSSGSTLNETFNMTGPTINITDGQSLNITSERFSIIGRGFNVTDQRFNLTDKGFNITVLERNKIGHNLQTETFTPTAPPQTTVTGIKFGEVAYVSSIPTCYSVPSMPILLAAMVVVACWFSAV